MVKNLPANEEDARDTGSIPGSGKSPGGGQGNPSSPVATAESSKFSDILSATL